MSPLSETSTTTFANSMASATNGTPFPPATSGAYAGGPGRKQPYPHIDDLTSVTVDLDPHTPLRKVLETGDGHMRQALTFSDFRRPDLALQEYIKAFVIAVDKIPKHKDYPSLKNDRNDLSRLYVALKDKITKNGARFDRIKEDIKSDNRRSGVQSMKSSADSLLRDLPNVPSTLPSHLKANGASSNSRSSATASPTHYRGESMGAPRSKPMVHPKPQALHGQAVKPGGSPFAQDLANRFAKLRDNERRPQTVSATKPLTTVVTDSMPTMPKLPDAIYSPARGTITSEVADLPSSTPRGLFSRTNSIASVTGPPSARTSIDLGVRPASVEPSANALNFSGSGSGSSIPTPPSPRIRIPQGTAISPEELQSYMQKGSSVVRLLLIDIRSREDFDDGHILSQATICVEPAVLVRGDISAADIEESLGIAPDDEMKAFENRGQFDLVVFYDQDSASLPQHRPSQDSGESALFTLYQALVQFNYGRELRHGPKLLVGGVDAWVDRFGQRSLQESKTSAAIREGQPRPRRRILNPRSVNKRRSRAETRTLKPEEQQQWERMVQAEEAVTSPQEFVRSTEEFLRRFPPPAEIRESMTSPASPHSAGSVVPGGKGFESDLPPAPPTRPAPAVPRTTYSGLSSREPEAGGAVAKANLATSDARDKPTGLVNGGMKCYANSLIQVLLFSPRFSAEFTQREWPTNWLRGAQKNPQLMSRILGNLLQWLAGRQFESMRAKTLFDYCRSIHVGYSNDSSRRFRLHFGDANQHDSAEFLDFLFDELQKETNRSAQTTATGSWQAVWDSLKDDTSPRKVARAALMSWQRYQLEDDSVLVRHWGLLSAKSGECTKCTHSFCNYGFNTSLMLGVGASDDMTPLTLLDILKSEFSAEQATIDTGFECGHTEYTLQNRIARLPPLLGIRFNRFAMGNVKIKRPVIFNIDNLDLGEFAIDYNGVPGASGIDGMSVGETMYDLYGVIVHEGQKLDAGHYFSYVRESQSKWFLCNDELVKEVQVRPDGSGGPSADWFKCPGTRTPYMLFYKRKDVPWGIPRRVEGAE